MAARRALPMPMYFGPRYTLSLPDAHRFPMERYERVRSLFLAQCGGDRSLFELRRPPHELATTRAVTRAHCADFVRRFVAGELDRKAERAIGFPWSPALVARTRDITGATLAATRDVLRPSPAGAPPVPVACNMAGGTHHAMADRGEGFCIWNDIAVAAKAALCPMGGGDGGGGGGVGGGGDDGRSSGGGDSDCGIGAWSAADYASRLLADGAGGGSGSGVSGGAAAAPGTNSKSRSSSGSSSSSGGNGSSGSGSVDVHQVLVLDLDVHQGNGTASICANDPRIFTYARSLAMTSTFSSSTHSPIPSPLVSHPLLYLLQHTHTLLGTRCTRTPTTRGARAWRATWTWRCPTT